MIKNIIKINAFIGDTVKIIKAPKKPPMYAPAIGISAVRAINEPIIKAYGSLNIIIPIAQREPKIIASVHCPTMYE